MSHTLEERCRQLMIQRKFEQCQKEIETAMAEKHHCAIPHKNFRCKVISYKIATGRWEKLQFHSYHPGSAATSLSDGGG